MTTKWKIEGECIVKKAGGQMPEWYEAEFELDTDEESIARSMIKKGYIRDHLRKTVDGFRRVRTVFIVSGKVVKERKEPIDDYEKKLKRAAKEGAMPEQLDNYGGKRQKEEALDRSYERKVSGKKKKKNSQVEDLGYID